MCVVCVSVESESVATVEGEKGREFTQSPSMLPFPFCVEMASRARLSAQHTHTLATLCGIVNVQTRVARSEKRSAGEGEKDREQEEEDECE